MTLFSKIAGAASGVALTCTAFAAQADVLFWSTQAKPVEESQAMREQVLSGFEAGADYQPNDPGPWITRLNAELQAGSGSIGVLGALEGDFSAMNPDDLVDLTDLGLASASETFNNLAKLGTDRRIALRQSVKEPAQALDRQQHQVVQTQTRQRLQLLG